MGRGLSQKDAGKPELMHMLQTGKFSNGCHESRNVVCRQECIASLPAVDSKLTPCGPLSDAAASDAMSSSLCAVGARHALTFRMNVCSVCLFSGAIACISANGRLSASR